MRGSQQSDASASRWVSKPTAWASALRAEEGDRFGSESASGDSAGASVDMDSAPGGARLAGGRLSASAGWAKLGGKGGSGSRKFLRLYWWNNMEENMEPLFSGDMFLVGHLFEHTQR